MMSISGPHRLARTIHGGISMRLHTAACLAVTLIVGVSGCTTPSAITRGQSVQHVGHNNHNVNTLPNRNGHVSSIQDYFEDKHVYADASSYHSTTGFPGYGGFAPHGAAGAGGAGYCPSGACPPGGCQSGHCGHGCGCGLGQPHHYHSYSYERPGNLVYPGPNAVGGSVVYPYYTHKGPSDFFRDDCR